MELTRILRAHAIAYPLMQPCDAVKLIYQNEFGGGHLIANAGDSLARILDEYTYARRSPGAAPTMPYEAIGNGLVRVRLASLDPRVYPLERLNEDFIRSCELHKGTLSGFLAKLDLLAALFDSLHFTFDKAALFSYLIPYRESGCPMVSHSEEYREAYRPAYRVVLEQFVL